MEGGGTLSLEEEGLRVHLRAVCPDRWAGAVQGVGQGAGREPAPGDFDTGEWKAGAVQDSEPVHAGTGGLLAGNGREYCAGISLYRTIRRRGAVEAEPDPARLCRDPLLRALLRGRTGFFSGQEGEARLLAAPFSDQKEFPLPVLFCLAQVEERAGRRWLVWRFDRAGNPVVPAHSRNGTGHTRGVRPAQRPEGGKDYVRFDHKGAPSLV